MTEEPSPGPTTSSRSVTPFTVFGIVAALAVGGAMWEMLYYATTPALEGASIGTTLGIAVAVIVFFVVAIFAPPNE